MSLEVAQIFAKDLQIGDVILPGEEIRPQPIVEVYTGGPHGPIVEYTAVVEIQPKLRIGAELGEHADPSHQLPELLVTTKRFGAHGERGELHSEDGIPDSEQELVLRLGQVMTVARGDIQELAS